MKERQRLELTCPNGHRLGNIASSRRPLALVCLSASSTPGLAWRTYGWPALLWRCHSCHITDGTQLHHLDAEPIVDTLAAMRYAGLTRLTAQIPALWQIAAELSRPATDRNRKRYARQLLDHAEQLQPTLRAAELKAARAARKAARKTSEPGT